jgi:hypothetical protein
MERVKIMEKLSVQNELRLLEKAMQKNEFLGSGSSRAVYGLDYNTVIKVVADAGGQKQNDMEVQIYNTYKSDKLAKIHAFGKFIIVMERVILDEQDDDEFYDVQDYLDDITGEHGDNYQIGRALDGRKVAYDYGLVKGAGYELQQFIGDVRHYIKQYGGPLGLLKQTKKKIIKAIFG